MAPSSPLANKLCIARSLKFKSLLSVPLQLLPWEDTSEAASRCEPAFKTALVMAAAGATRAAGDLPGTCLNGTGTGGIGFTSSEDSGSWHRPDAAPSTPTRRPVSRARDHVTRSAAIAMFSPPKVICGDINLLLLRWPTQSLLMTHLLAPG